MKLRFLAAGVIGAGITAGLLAALTVLYSNPGPQTGDGDAANVVPGSPAGLDQPSVASAQSAGSPHSADSGSGFQDRQAAGSPDSGPSEGVQVHGRWTVDVLEPDGTLVEHYAFNNALTSLGSTRIADILARRMVPLYWGVSLRHSQLSNSPCANNGNPTSCVIAEPRISQQEYINNNLTVTPDDGILTLSGSIDAGRDGQINLVRTNHNGSPCSDSASFPDDCSGNAGTQVTSATLSDTIDVAAGQTISVTVHLEFE